MSAQPNFNVAVPAGFDDALQVFRGITTEEERAPHPVSGDGEDACRNDTFNEATHLHVGAATVTVLAFRLADIAARSDIELYCHDLRGADHNTWHDTNRVRYGFARGFIDEALRYLDLRGGIRRNAEQPHLVTFAGVTG